MIAKYCAGAALLAAAGPAWAEPDLFSGDQLRGFLDLRAGASDGERSWVDQGFGKTRFSGAGDDAALRLTLGDAALLWAPNFTWSLRGHVHLQSEPHQDHAVDMVEAYLDYKPMPIGQTHVDLRAGLMYPPVSLEHDGPAWTTTNTITPSAINTWIGEEVKVLGVEAGASHRFGGQDFGARLGLFGYNDTSGTLLSYRGWALHDILTTAFGDMPLPQQSLAWQIRKASQAMSTAPTRELDNRVGYYGRLDWTPRGDLALNVEHYDNAGDRLSHRDGQWAWETRFSNLGLVAQLSPQTRLLAQAMRGETIYGMNTPGVGYWTELDFSAAYLLVAHDIGANRISGRIDVFSTEDKSSTVPDDNDEDGWALTGAYRVALRPDVSLAFEGLHVESDRPARTGVGLASQQDQTTLQSALRFWF